MTDKPSNEKTNGKTGKKVSIYAVCDCCGYPIYSPDEAIIINDTEDVIHKECWPDYSAEHIFSFATPASISEHDEDF